MAMEIQGIATTMYQWDRTYRDRGMTFEEHLGTALAEMKDTGLDGVQTRLIYADTEEKAERHAAQCGAADLRIAAAYGNCKLFDAAELNDQVERFVAEAKAVKRAGVTLIVLNMHTPHGRGKTDEENALQAKGLQRLGDELEPEGVRIDVHNHTPEMKDDAREFRYLMDHVRSEAVGVCLDIAWATVAGVSPIALIDEYHDRVFDIHVRNVSSGVFTQAVPEGEISYADILGRLDRYDYRGWLVVELAYDPAVEVTRPFISNIERSVWYLKGMTARG